MSLRADFIQRLTMLGPWIVSILIATIAIQFWKEEWPWSVSHWIGFFSTAIAIRIVFALRRPWGAIPPEYCDPASHDATVRTVIVQLRMRAVRLRLVAHFTLFLILLSLVGGLYTFGFAEQFAVRAEIDRSVQLQVEIEATKNAIARTKSRLENESVKFPEDVYGWEMDLKASENRLVFLEEELKRRRATTTTTGQSETIYLVSVLSTKIGSALMLLFLVQILVTLYRYNVRFASFCDARADALQLLITSEGIPLGEVIALLAPDKLDFGKTPSTPLQNVVDLAKEMASIRGK